MRGPPCRSSEQLGLEERLDLDRQEFPEFAHYPDLLIPAQLWIHRKRKDFCSNLFCDGKIPLLMPKRRIRVLKVQRNRIANSRAYADGYEMLHQFCSLLNSHH